MKTDTDAAAAATASAAAGSGGSVVAVWWQCEIAQDSQASALQTRLAA